MINYGLLEILSRWFGESQRATQGLALALVSPSAFIALLAYAGAGQVDWVVGLPLALGGMAAISAGVAFATRLPERRMRLAFCALLLLTAVLLALRRDRSPVWFRGMRWPHHSLRNEELGRVVRSAQNSDDGHEQTFGNADRGGCVVGMFGCVIIR
jgi:uncharacterized membrane protein YfcA